MNVVILGNLGGAKAVNTLVVSPLAQGLFQRAISSSGYPNSIKGTYKLANKRYRVLLNDTGCSTTTQPEKIIQCLQTLYADFIVEKLPWTLYPGIDYWNFPSNENTNEIVTDVLDPVLHPEPIGLNQGGPNENIDIMIGYTSQEGMTQDFANSWEGLYNILKPRVDSFKNRTYQKILNLCTRNDAVEKTVLKT